MKIVLDLQPCQSSSRLRGIGRSCLQFALEFAKLAIAKGDSVVFLLNGQIDDNENPLDIYLKNAMPKIRVNKFYVPLPCNASKDENAWRQIAAEVLREVALYSLNPDVVHLSQIAADGWDDNTVTSIDELGMHLPTTLMHHDLIPLSIPNRYLDNLKYKDFYLKKISYIDNADLIFSISEYSREELIKYLKIRPSKVHTVFSGVSQYFISTVDEGVDGNVVANIDVGDDYILYVPGGFDYRKNIPMLIEAYSRLPESISDRAKLVIVSKINFEQRNAIESLVELCGLPPTSVVLTDYVGDEVLKNLYKNCGVCVFPSIHEGFGLPILEAMASGAPVIASDCSSLPEVVGNSIALFDPYSADSIKDKIQCVLTNKKFREELKRHSSRQSKLFSWKITSEKAYEILNDYLLNRKERELINPVKFSINYESILEIIKLKTKKSDFTQDELNQIKFCYEKNVSLYECNV